MGKQKWKYTVVREQNIERKEKQEHLARCATPTFMEREIKFEKLALDVTAGRD